VRIVLDNGAIDDLVTGGLLLAGDAWVLPLPLLSPFFSAPTFSSDYLIEIFLRKFAP
jgi:hypothetical protein